MSRTTNSQRRERSPRRGSKQTARHSREPLRKALFRRWIMAKKKKISPLTKALLETAGDMRKAGLMDRSGHEKITLRHLGAADKPAVAPVTGPQIRAMRERAKLSQ